MPVQTPNPPRTGIDSSGPSTYTSQGSRWQRSRSWLTAFARSFIFASSGIVILIRTQRNAQVHLFLTIIICVIGAFWGLTRIEWLVLLVTIALVLAMEALNTAIEAVVDLASPEYHPLAKRAKDIAAGGVLLVAIFAVAIALVLFGERLLTLIQYIFS